MFLTISRAVPDSGRILTISLGSTLLPNWQLAPPFSTWLRAKASCTNLPSWAGAAVCSGGAEWRAVTDSHHSPLGAGWELSDQRSCDRSVLNIRVSVGQIQQHTDPWFIVAWSVCVFCPSDLQDSTKQAESEWYPYRVHIPKVDPLIFLLLLFFLCAVLFYHFSTGKMDYPSGESLLFHVCQLNFLLSDKCTLTMTLEANIF